MGCWISFRKITVFEVESVDDIYIYYRFKKKVRKNYREQRIRSKRGEHGKLIGEGENKYEWGPAHVKGSPYPLMNRNALNTEKLCYFQ